MRYKIISLLSVILIVINICACNNTENISQDNYRHQNITINKEENEQLLIEIRHFIENTGTGNELSRFSKDVSINTDDIIIGTGIKSYNYYVSGNAAYLQIDNLMYRFQLDTNNIVVSYIKYEVEA